MKKNFWNKLPRPFFTLAPVEDVTGIVFRHVISKVARPDVSLTKSTDTESFRHLEGVHSVRGCLALGEGE